MYKATFSTNQTVLALKADSDVNDDLPIIPGAPLPKVTPPQQNGIFYEKLLSAIVRLFHYWLPTIKQTNDLQLRNEVEFIR